jgi:ABC-type sulfate transport system permease subunit
VFRLFRRLDALKQILISLGYAVKPVASAALFVLIFSSLYAVIGVVFFSEPEELKVIFHSSMSVFIHFCVHSFIPWVTRQPPPEISTVGLSDPHNSGPI